MSEVLLKPFSQNHSIKEAVITLFLASPIIKPERFQELISKGLSDDFHLYEPVNAVQFQFKATNNGMFPEQQSQPNVGFKFLAFKQGKIGRTLQGVNEVNRTFISYHNFVYERWGGYLTEYLEILKTLVDFHADIFVKAVSVHYIDEFGWISESQLDLTKVFNQDAVYMSKAFLASSNTSNFIFNTEKAEKESLFFDRLEIKVDNKIKKNISISHNGTMQFDDFKALSSLIDEEKEFFVNSLQSLHEHNKQILRDILNSDIKSLINLP